MKRRTLLWMGLGAAGALAVGYAVMPPRPRMTGGADNADAPGSFTPNAWVRIAPDGRITLFMPRAEMGQGSHTGLAMLLAEELGCALAAVSIEAAPIASVYNNLAVGSAGLPYREDDDSVGKRMAEHFTAKFVREFGFMVTGGSTSVRDLWTVLREAGAMARETLRNAAARHWQIPVGECLARDGRVVRADGRSLGFGEIVAFGANMLEPVTEISLKKPADWTLIGTSARRLEARAKVTGTALFAADIHEAGMLYAEVSFSPYHDGLCVLENESTVRARPGVAGVLKLESTRGAPPVVVVVADQRWRAKQAMSALDIQWFAGDSGKLSQARVERALTDALIDEADADVYLRTGSPQRVLDGSTTILRAEYSVPYLSHAAMEPLCCAVKHEGEQASVWVGTQVPDVARGAAAEALELDAERVTLWPLLLGGGFGRRLESDFVAIAARIAREHPGKLVQVLWSREADQRNDYFRPAVMARLAAVVAPTPQPGTVSALVARTAGQSVGAQAIPRQLGLPAGSSDRSNVEGSFNQPYAFEHHEVKHTNVELPVPVGYWRSVGHSQQAFFNESFIDEMASWSRVDPVRFRLNHLEQRPRHRAVLELVAEKSGWREREQRFRTDGETIGRGVALHESFGSIVAIVAEVILDQDERPRVRRIVVAVDCGVVVNPNLVTQQMESAVVYGLSAALYGRITFSEDGGVAQTNFDRYPVLRLAETPPIETWLVRSEASPGGVGEPGVPPVAPAVASALAALTGRRYRRLPLIGA
ncbi:MAG: molybdopterin-dependent oxidoreductase [Gammaproteobacteria bacterium]|nr:molybdopterin-dependent oxidoreductase [Gammaproteobacteria bacterium]